MHNNFNDVDNKTLQAYNRAVMALNLFDDRGEEATTRYLKQFDEQDRVAIAAMIISVRINADETKRKVYATV